MKPRMLKESSKYKNLAPQLLHVGAFFLFMRESHIDLWLFCFGQNLSKVLILEFFGIFGA